MFASGLLAPRLGLGLGLRGQIALGTVLLAVPALAALAVRRRPGERRSARAPSPSARRRSRPCSGPPCGSAASVSWRCNRSSPRPRLSTSRLFRGLHSALAPTGPIDALVSLAVIAVLPGAVRGAGRPRRAAALARSPLGPAGAVVASALLFAAMHLDPYRFLFTFDGRASSWACCGCAPARCGPPIVAHVTLNALTFAIAPLVDDPAQPYTPQPRSASPASSPGPPSRGRCCARSAAAPTDPPDCPFPPPCYPRLMRILAFAAACLALSGAPPGPLAGPGDRRRQGRPQRAGRPSPPAPSARAR